MPALGLIDERALRERVPAVERELIAPGHIGLEVRRHRQFLRGRGKSRCR